jgi:hypothetical protein
MRARAVLAVTLLPLAVSGCEASVEVGGKGFDRAKAQRLISRTVAGQVGAQVRGVACPSDVELKQGTQITCTVTGIDGSKGPAYVRFKDDEGNVSVSAPLLHVREAEQAISGRFVAKYGGQVLVRCPEIVRVVRGRTFRCTATKGGEKATVEATLTDAAGHFRFRTVTP